MVPVHFQAFSATLGGAMVVVHFRPLAFTKRWFCRFALAHHACIPYATLHSSANVPQRHLGQYGRGVILLLAAVLEEEQGAVHAGL